MMELKRVTREQWVTALRSGDYRQETGRLWTRDDSRIGTPGGFCCLGVLGELAGGEKVGAPYVVGRMVFDGYDTPIDAHLPDEIAEMVGISRLVQGRLAEKNDIERLTFAEIADYIETLPFQNPRDG